MERKAIPAVMRDVFTRVAVTSMAPTVEAVDPFQNVFWTSYRLYGSKGELGLRQQLTLEEIDRSIQRIATLGPLMPECPEVPPGGAGGVGMLPGMFELLGVPFSAGELNAPGSQGMYQRTYLPGPRQRLEAGVAIALSSMRLVKYAANLHDDFTLNEGAHFGIDYPGGGDGDWPMRSLPLKKFIEMMNLPRVQDRILEDMDTWFMTQEEFGEFRPHWVTTDSIYLGGKAEPTVQISSDPFSLVPISVESIGNFPVKSIRPTQQEWNEQWGAQDFFSRGGFIVDLNMARGNTPYSPKGTPDHVACIAWCRASQFKTVYPTGEPQCLLPVTIMTDQIAYWTKTVNVTGERSSADPYGVSVYDGLYRVKWSPHPKSTWDRAVQALVEFGSTVIRSLCDNDDAAAKSAAALIEFVKLQGKDAATAQASAKTPEAKILAAEKVAKYKAGVLELTIAMTMANTYCAANPERAALQIPAAELPAVEPPTRVVKLIDYLMPGRVTAGRSSAASPTKWSTATLIGLGLLGAAGGALVLSRKRK